MSEYLVRIGTLEKKSEKNIADQWKMLEEKEGLMVQAKDLEWENSDLEEQLRSKNHETDQMLAEKERLQDRISELENEYSALQKKSKDGEDEASVLQIERGKQESSESLTQVENKNSELANKVADQQRMLKEQKDAFNELGEEHKRLEVLFQECKANIEVVERKIEGMEEEELQKSIESKYRKVDEL
ncbi:hypothetical protein ACSBR1_022495 [Camellia fascicularis]